MTSQIIQDAVKKVASDSELSELVGMDEQQIKQAVETEVTNSVSNVINSIVEEDQDPDPLDWLKKTNEFLEGVPEGIVSYFDNLGELDLPQNQVDKICEYAAWKVNLCIEKVRQQVIRVLRRQCKQVKDILKFMKKLKEGILNPLSALEAVVQLIKMIIEKLLGPYYELVKFIVKLTVEIAKLANNLQNIMEVLPPNPPSGSINFNKFNLKIGSVTMDMIMDDGGQEMQNPEAMFPEPEKPFTKSTFKEIYNQVKPNTNTIIYKPDVTSGGSTNSDLA